MLTLKIFFVIVATLAQVFVVAIALGGVIHIAQTKGFDDPKGFANPTRDIVVVLVTAMLALGAAIAAGAI